MKKAINLIATTLYLFILFMLAIYTFWEGFAKKYVEKYIDVNYGQEIKETYNNTELIKQFDIPIKNDKGKS